MKTLALIALSLPLCAGAVELTFGDPLPVDPSGYPIETNDLQRAVVMLQARICRLEAYAMSNAVEKAESERRRRARAKASEAESAERAKRLAVNSEHDRWLADCRSKYGKMVLVGTDTNTCERMYRRIDGVIMRKKAYDPEMRTKRVKGDK